MNPIELSLEQAREIEQRLLMALAAFVRERVVPLEDTLAEFLVAPWCHFFSHGAVHRWSLCPQSQVSLPLSGKVPGDTLAFMELSRTNEYKAFLDGVLRGQVPDYPCRESLEVLRFPRFYAVSTVFSGGFPREAKYRLQMLSLGRIYFSRRERHSRAVAVQGELRQLLGQHLLHALADLPCASYLAALVPQLFPRSLLEDLASNLQAKQTLHKNRILYSCNGWDIIDDWKIYAITQKRQGALWYGAPHAINHGCLSIFWQREFELRYLDRYLSWGWRAEQYRRNLMSFFSPKTLGFQPKAPARIAPQGDYLLSTAGRPQHLLEYPYSPERFEVYLNSQFAMAMAIADQSGSKVTIRGRYKDFGWDLSARVAALGNPLVTSELQASPFVQRLRQAKAHICDTTSTTIVDSLWENYPTLICINNTYFELAPFALDDFEILKKVGIFHTDLPSLLAQLARVQDDIEGWWQTDAVQKAVAEFLWRQGRVSSGYRPWLSMLTDLNAWRNND